MSEDAATGSRTPVTDGPPAGGTEAPDRPADNRADIGADRRGEGRPGGGADDAAAGSRRVDADREPPGRDAQGREPQGHDARARGPQADQARPDARQRPGGADPAAGAPTTVLPASGGRPPRPAARAERGGDRSSPPRAGGERQAPTRGGAERQGQGRAGGRRRARLAVQRLDPWSVFLFSLVASICLGVVLFVAVAALYAALSSLGVLASLNGVLGEVAGTGPDTEVVDPFITPSLVLGATAVLAAINVVLLTALATLGALIYNLCASLTGGIEVQLGERE